MLCNGLPCREVVQKGGCGVGLLKEPTVGEVQIVRVEDLA